VNPVDQTDPDLSLHKILLEQSKEFIKSRRLPCLSPRELITINNILSRKKLNSQEACRNWTSQPKSPQNATIIEAANTTNINIENQKLIETLKNDLELSSIRQKSLETNFANQSLDLQKILDGQNFELSE
jgi:hypothetical protein